MIDWKKIGTFLRKWYQVKWWRKFFAETEKSFLKWEKMASRKIFRHFLRANFFMYILLISNHTVFLVQFGVNLHLWVFQKAHSCKLIPNWTRNRMTTYTKRTNDDVFDDFPRISDHFRKISEDFPKLFQRPDERFRTFSQHYRTFSEDYRRLPKTAEDDRRRSEDVSIIHQQI